MKQDTLWNAWCQHKYGTITPTLTKSERGRLNRALKELRDVNATPEDMKAKIKVYEQKFKGCEVTITGLAANWNSLIVKPTVRHTASMYVGPRELTEAEREQARKVASETLPARYAARLQR